MDQAAHVGECKRMPAKSFRKTLCGLCFVGKKFGADLAGEEMEQELGPGVCVPRENFNAGFGGIEGQSVVSRCD